MNERNSRKNVDKNQSPFINYDEVKADESSIQLPSELSKHETSLFDLNDEQSQRLKEELIDLNILSTDSDMVSLLHELNNETSSAASLPSTLTSRTSSHDMLNALVNQTSIWNDDQMSKDILESMLASDSEFYMLDSTSSLTTPTFDIKNPLSESYTKTATLSSSKSKNIKREPTEASTTASTRVSARLLNKRLNSVKRESKYDENEYETKSGKRKSQLEDSEASIQSSKCSRRGSNLNLNSNENSMDSAVLSSLSSASSSFSPSPASSKSARIDQIESTKKDSNKDAAFRYRLKKLSEKDQMFETRLHLERENDEVKRRIDLTKAEICYLKDLLVQMLLNKGLLDSSRLAAASTAAR